MDDTRRILVLTHNGKLFLVDNGKQRGTVVAEFNVTGQNQRLTGGCKICKEGNTAYVGLYGGKVVAISNGSIVK